MLYPIKLNATRERRMAFGVRGETVNCVKATATWVESESIGYTFDHTVHLLPNERP